MAANSALALHLASIPAALNPLINRAAWDRLAPRVQQAVSDSAGLASQIATSAPPASMVPGPAGDQTGTVSQVAQGSAPPNTTIDPTFAAHCNGARARLGSASPAGGPWNPSFPSPGFKGWEQDARVNIVASLKRKPFPIHFIPAKMTTDANGVGRFVWTPQEDVQPFRIVFVAASETSDAVSGVAGVDGALVSLIVGTRVIGVNSGLLQMSLFSQFSDGGRLDFPYCPANEQVIANIAGATATTDYYALLLAYAPNSSDQSDGGSEGMARMGYVNFNGTAGTNDSTLTPGQTKTFSAVVQERFKLRRLLVDPNDNNAAQLLISQIQIATRVEGSQQGSHPAILWSQLAQDDWVDFDTCPRNSTIAVTVVNTNATASATCALGGTGDVWYADEERQYGRSACRPGC